MRTPVRGRRAFSLIEILMTVAMLSVIILGLVAMFDQTRRAFTSSMTQVDVLEGGRAATALIASDLEQLTPTYASNVENFFMYISPTISSYSPTLTTTTQPLNDPVEVRTNTLQELYFVSRNNQQWNIIGYRVDSAGEANGIGTLYRYSLNNIPVNGPIPPLSPPNANSNLMSVLTDFTTNGLPTNNFARVIDGVIDFRVRTYDMNGKLIYTNFSNDPNITVTSNTVTGEMTYYRFMSNVVPAYVEVELGILETRALQRYNSMTNIQNNPRNPTALGYLTNHAGQVHMFRQRVPIRAVNAAVPGVNPTGYTNYIPALP